MQQILQRGFTLIELLVVIAIIGILAAVVLTSLGGAQTSAIDSNIQQGMAGIPAEAQAYYNRNNFSYTGVCADTINATLGNIEDGAGQLDSTMWDCNDDTTEWAATFQLQSEDATDDYWCVDSEGNREFRATAIGTALSCS